jgi:hypothetical protein
LRDLRENIEADIAFISSSITLRSEIGGMMSDKKPKQDDPEQSKRFIEGAREAEADETGKGAERAVKAVVKPRKPKNKGLFN